MTGEFPGEIDGYSLYLPETHGQTRDEFPVLFYLPGGCYVGGKVDRVDECQFFRRMRKEVWAREKERPSDVTSFVLDTFIVVVPHLNGGAYKDRQFYQNVDAFRTILGELQTHYYIDLSRVYLTGIGRGGHGVYGLGSRMPNTFAALAPIRGNTEGVDDYAALARHPLWIGHSTCDEEVAYEESEDAVREMESIAGVEFLRRQELGLENDEQLAHHHIFTAPKNADWPDLYGTREFYEWLLRHKLPEGTSRGR